MVATTAVNAIRSLGKRGHAELAHVMKSKNPIARAHAVIGLIDAGHESVPLLLTALDDPEPRVREFAAANLASIQTADKNQVAASRKAMFDADPVVRHFTMRALFKLDGHVEGFLRERSKLGEGKDRVIAAGALMEKAAKGGAQGTAALAPKRKVAGAKAGFESDLQCVAH